MSQVDWNRLHFGRVALADAAAVVASQKYIMCDVVAGHVRELVTEEAAGDMADLSNLSPETLELLLELRREERRKAEEERKKAEEDRKRVEAEVELRRLEHQLRAHSLDSALAARLFMSSPLPRAFSSAHARL